MDGSVSRFSFTFTAQIAEFRRYEVFVVASKCTYGWALVLWPKSKQEGQKTSEASIVDSISTVVLRLTLWQIVKQS